MSNGTQGGWPAGPRVTFRPFEGGSAGLRAPQQDWLRQGVVPRRGRRGVSCGSAERGPLMPGNRLAGWRSGWALKAACWKTKTLCASAKITLTKTSSPRLPHLGALLGSTSKAGKGCWLWFYIEGDNTGEYGVLRRHSPLRHVIVESFLLISFYLQQ